MYAKCVFACCEVMLGVGSGRFMCVLAFVICVMCCSLCVGGTGLSIVVEVVDWEVLGRVAIMFGVRV